MDRALCRASAEARLGQRQLEEVLRAIVEDRVAEAHQGSIEMRSVATQIDLALRGMPHWEPAAEAVAHLLAVQNLADQTGLYAAWVTEDVTELPESVERDVSKSLALVRSEVRAADAALAGLRATYGLECTAP
jgi:hypothetical protein